MTTAGERRVSRRVHTEGGNTVLKKVLIILVVIIGLILVVGFLLPTTYHVERSRVVAAPPEALYAVVNDFKQWPKWDPWAGKDATMKYTYEGSPTGVGSVQHYTSENSGEGTIRITESEPGRKVKMEMDFKMGEEELPTATYTFEPIGDGKTKVTWSMDGETSMRPIGSYFGLMMDSMIGPDFERGLENLDKAVTSAPAAAAPAPAAVEPAVEPAAVEPAAAPAEDAPAEAAPAEPVE